MDTSNQSGSGAQGIQSAFASNNYFEAVESPAKSYGASNLAQPYTILKPKGSGLVDVTNTMRWSNYTSTDEVPSVFITEKQIEMGTWAANFLEIIKQAKNVSSGKGLDSYVSLYAAKNTGFWYNLPFLLKNGDNINAVGNTWNPASTIGDLINTVAGGGTGKGAKTGGLIGGVLNGILPGVGFEQTMQYGGSSPLSLTLSFPLYNTISQEDAFNHFSFINLFAFQNMKTRTSLLTFLPPKIYVVDAGSIGGKYMAAAYVSEFKVDSIGTTRKLWDYAQFGPKEILIPEAYKVTITFVDLLSPSSNIFSATMGGSKIEITNAPTTIEEAYNLGKGAVIDTVNNTKSAVAKGVQFIESKAAAAGIGQGG
jgi:hypothetical protein